METHKAQCLCNPNRRTDITKSCKNPYCDKGWVEVPTFEFDVLDFGYGRYPGQPRDS